jgi:DNA polymerase III epsilon subunit-like protein
LVGGDLSDIDPEWFASKNSNSPQDQLPLIKKELAEIIKKLNRKKHVIVGHNLFMDLAFIYKTFIGALPAKVGHFQQMVHEHFPSIIDTKYLATHETNAMNPQTNLKELLEPFKKVRVPLVVLHEHHTAYSDAYGKDHEAGYDSWMTAELFVKLSAKLYSTYDPSVASDDNDLRDLYGNSAVDVKSHDCHNTGGFCSDDESDSSAGGGAALMPRSTSPKKNQNTDTARIRCAKTCSHSGLIKKQINTIKIDTTGSGAVKELANATKSSLGAGALAQHVLDVDSGSMAMQNTLPLSYHGTNLTPNAIYINDTDEAAAAGATDHQVQQWIPDMKNPFWNAFVNKLRVNAVQGGVCDLAEPLAPEDKDGDVEYY